MKEQRPFIQSIVITILELTIVGLIVSAPAVAAEYNSQEIFLKSTLTPFASTFNGLVRENSAGMISSRKTSHPITIDSMGKLPCMLRM